MRTSSELLWCTTPGLCTRTSAFLTVLHSSQFTYFLILTQSPFVCRWHPVVPQLFISFQSNKFNENISCLQIALSAIADLMTSNLLCFNCVKTEFLLLGLKPQLNKIHNSALTLSNGASVCPSPSARNLGFIFDARLTFSDQISSLARSCFCHFRDLRRIHPVLDFSTAHIIGTSLVHSKLGYCNSLYYGLPKTQLTRLQHPEFSCSCRCCSSQVFWSRPDSQISPLP